MEIEDLVPKNKFDVSGMEELKKLSDAEIEPIVPALLEWMKDGNWPVAREIPALLAGHPNIVVPYIREVLEPAQLENDWKDFIIWTLLPLLEEECLLALKPCLERLAKEPMSEEREDGTSEVAEEFLRERRLLD